MPAVITWQAALVWIVFPLLAGFGWRTGNWLSGKLFK